jgi:hypothetical protein
MSQRSPTSSVHSTEIPSDLLAAAAQRRAQNAQPTPEAQRIQEYELRQAFRRLIDPGILRPNSKDVALASLNTLLTISENLLREPENPKFQQFKSTNDTIKRRLIDPKGALEYAIALGFRPEVQNFQPYYRFNPRKTLDLRIGAAILKETVDLEKDKQERSNQAKREEKAVAMAAANNIKLAFLDDRKTKMLRDQRDRERREARAAAVARGEVEETPQAISSSIGDMPGTGQSLMPLQPNVSMDSPPAYDDSEDEMRI